MAESGYHKNLTSTSEELEIKRAGKEWECCGTFTERGERPGALKDVWMVGRSRRCLGRISQHSLYVANQKIPPFISINTQDPLGFLPTCLHCAMDAYSEYFHGSEKALYMKPMTDEVRERTKKRIVRLLEDVKQFRPGENGTG